MKKLSFQNQVLIGFAIAVVVVVILGVFSFKSTQLMTESSRMINHTQEVLNRSNEVYLLLLNAETGQRGFIITGNEEYLAPYRSSVSKVDDAIDELERWVSDNPSQIKMVDSIRYYASLKVEEMSFVLGLRRNSLALAQQRINVGEGKRLMMNIRRNVSIFMDEEIRLLKLRQKQTDESTALNYTASTIGVVFVLIVFVFMFWYISKTFKLQRQAEKEITIKNEELLVVSEQNIRRNWILTGTSAIYDNIRGEHAVKDLANNIVKCLSTYVDAKMGALYLYNEETKELVLTGTYAFGLNHTNHVIFKRGEGLIGQAAIDKKINVYQNLPADYVKITSGLGGVVPKTIVVLPIVNGDQLQGVAELAFAEDIENKIIDFFGLVGETLAIAIHSAKAREVMHHQAEELQAQQEELQQTNEELISQTNLLQASEEELRVQQEELQQTNEELEEKAELLELKNKAVEEAREAIIQKAAELELTNKYKSEFLANMSHELRTPLNSILILAKLLSENRANNLSEGDVKYATVIYNSGNDLLTLINDILDLSKIESGKLEMSFESTYLDELTGDIDGMFRHIADNKHINFVIEKTQDVPQTITTDKQRLIQVLRNLLSNAFKFTSQGGQITLKLHQSNNKMLFSVIDTGIGISPDKQQIIFEAFQQADGTTNRKYGGTGLGLSISRELTNLLGGEITLQSKVGEGSTFTLAVPFEYAVPYIPNQQKEEEAHEPLPSLTSLGLSFDDIVKSKDSHNNLILIIEDDVAFASILKDYAESKGFKALVAHDGKKGLQLAQENTPRAVLLDVMLPLMDGWEVLKAIKADEKLRHVPVHIMSANEQNGSQAASKGALSFVEKPVSTTRLEQLFLSIGTLLNSDGNEQMRKKVLIIEDNEIENTQLKESLSKQGMDAIQAFSAQEGLAQLEQNTIDCVILDLMLGDKEGIEVLRTIKSKDEWKALPVIINTAMDIPKHVHDEIVKYSNAFILKNKRSNERLMDEIRLFMNKVQKADNNPKVNQDLPLAKNINQTINAEKVLKNKKVLIVDDDMRNVFALSSILDHYHINIEIANNGVEALDKVKEHTDIDLVLMDIMMPEMDGYEAMKRIRVMPQYKTLPIIALTAKAMKNDREKCIEAGASDYLPKPIDTDKLISLMRVWLSQ